MTKEVRRKIWIGMIILIVGGAGGYFNYYFRRFHLRLPGFTLEGIRTFTCGKVEKKIYLYRHKQTGMNFVLVPPTALSKGKEKKTIKPFLMSQTSVTQGVWEKIMATTPWKALGISSHKDYPATGMTWFKAVEFCRRTKLRLPDPERWQSACQGGAKTTYFWGNSLKDSVDYSWFPPQKKKFQIHRVARKKPNGYGLFDMAHLIREWVDKSGPSSGLEKRAVKMVYSSSSTNPKSLLPSHKEPLKAKSRLSDVGFRCVFLPRKVKKR